MTFKPKFSSDLALDFQTKQSFTMEQGTIAFIDVLGFKGIWQDRNPEFVVEIFMGVEKRVQETHNQNNTCIKNQIQSAKIPPPSVTVLSDTIVIVIRSDNTGACLTYMSLIIVDLFRYFSSKDLFFRGAIGYGDFYQNGNTFIGPAIDDVATWYEAANWIGVIATPKTSFIIDTFASLQFSITAENKELNIPCYIKYNVPSKEGGKKYNLNSLNWPAYIETQFTGVPKGIYAAEKEMKKSFSRQPPFGNDVLIKYEYTLDFVRYSCTKYYEIKDQ